MRKVKLFQSSRYETDQYKIIHYIYYLDTNQQKYIIALIGVVDAAENPYETIQKLAEQFRVDNTYIEVVTYDNNKFCIFELCGNPKRLIEVSAIIGKDIKPVYSNGEVLNINIVG